MSKTSSEILLPREKALQFGIDSLTDKELLAILIGSGGKDNSVFLIADSLLRTYGSLSLLSKANYKDISAQKGLKDSKALKLITAFEIHRRLNTPKYQNEVILDSIDKIYARYKYLEDYDQEILCLIMLNSRKRILKEKVLYQGTCEGFSINLKEIISEILISKCSSFILVHNHVDELISPSQDDLISTRIINYQVKNLGLKLLDHLIIYKNGYYSLKEHNDFK